MHPERRRLLPVDTRFRIDGYRVNKRQAWLTKHAYVSVGLDVITYLDDTLDDRKATATGKAA
jgi:hypothetical protein